LKKKIVILVTCGGAYHAPGIINHLKKLKKINTKVISTDINSDSIGKYFANYFFKVSEGGSRSFINEIISICKKKKVDFIIPFSDEEALNFSKNIDKFNKIKVKVLVSDYKITRFVSNKLSLMEFIKKEGIETPKFYSPKNINEVNYALKMLGFPKKKVVFKPINQRGGRGFRILNSNFDEYDEVTKKKKEFFISKERLEKIILKRKFSSEFILMEYLAGEDFNVDVLAKEGSIINYVAQRRLEPKHGSLEKGMVDKDKKIKKYLEDIFSKIKFDNLVNLEMAYQKKNKKGKLLLYEVNARASAPIIISAKAGYSLLENAIYSKIGVKISNKRVSNIKMMRYWGEFFLN
tara:strand:+ start:17893 stop:18939 length:1047 start_codon:yes stop_codon:yes gene_type:complete